MLIFSVFLGLASKTFFGFWIALELNILLFVALLRLQKTSSSIATLIYFIPQALTSATLLFSVLFMAHDTRTIISEWGLPLAIFIKLGIAPAHLWFIQIRGLLNTYLFLLLSTTQKILPLFLATILVKKRIIFFLVISIILRSFLVLSQKRILIVLAFSSIFSGCWVLSPAKMRQGILYFSLYTITLIVILGIIKELKIQTLGDVWGLNPSQRFFLISTLLALTGIPPAAIFLGKLFVLSHLVSTHNWALAAILLAGSFAFFWAYARILFGQTPLRKSRLCLAPSFHRKNTPVWCTMSILLFRAPWLLYI